VFTSSDSGDWEVSTQTVYVTLADDNQLYVDDDPNLNPTTTDSTPVNVIDQTGDEVTLFGNKYVLVSTFPTGANQICSFKLGFYCGYDGAPSNFSMKFYVLIAVPKYAPAHDWTWTVTITGSTHSTS